MDRIRDNLYNSFSYRDYHGGLKIYPIQEEKENNNDTRRIKKIRYESN
jgi:hypothetical protein